MKANGLIQLSPLVSVYPAESIAPPVATNGIALAQIPSSAFGDGTHPTTRLCAGAVDFICRTLKPLRVLDVGTGTGVLARIALERGARRVVGTDIDEDAIRSARANSALDPFSPEQEIFFTHLPPDHWGAAFELVVANILEAPLRSLAPSLARALLPGGQLLISGFTPLQIPALRVVFAEEDLVYVNESILQDWALLMFRRT